MGGADGGGYVARGFEGGPGGWAGGAVLEHALTHFIILAFGGGHVQHAVAAPFAGFLFGEAAFAAARAAQ